MSHPSQLILELLEQSRNQKIREMFTNKEAGNEIDIFIAKHHLHSKKEGLGDQPTGVVLTGKLADLQDFIKTFLSEDSGRGVYVLRESKD